MKLPFRDPDYDLNLNLGIILITISMLSKTKRGKPVLNNDRLHIYLCLLKNPPILNNVLSLNGSENIKLNDSEAYSVNSIAPNLDALFDSELLKSLLSISASRKWIKAEYRKNDGFFYSLTESGQLMFETLSEEYFCEIKSFCQAIEKLQTKSVSQVNLFINQTLKVGK